MIGDPSGKSEERNLLSREQLDINVAGIRKQLEKHLDFNPGLKNSAALVNNYDWFKDLGFIDFLRDVGKHITVNYMMAKDSVKKRIEGDTGISYTGAHPQESRGRGFCFHLSTDHQSRWRQVWQNGKRQCMAQRGKNYPLPVLPVLVQCI